MVSKTHCCLRTKVKWKGQWNYCQGLVSDAMHLMTWSPWISSTFHTALSRACPVHSPPCRANSFTYLHGGSPSILVFPQHKTGTERRDAQCIYSPSSPGIYPLLPHPWGQAVSKLPSMENIQEHMGCTPCRCTTCKVSHCKKTAIGWKQGEGTAGKKSTCSKRHVLSSITPGRGKKSRDTTETPQEESFQGCSEEDKGQRSGI